MQGRISPPPTPGVSNEALSWARQQGRAAGLAGLPPIPPTAFALCAKAWGEGWQHGAEDRKMNGWRKCEVDYEWKGRDV
jgi:hypothetical protein